MNLKNAFSERVKDLWFMCFECVLCLQNGSDCGGLELHHIGGRASSSALNAALVCKRCHIKMGHSEKEEKELFREVLAYYYNKDASLKKSDWIFVEEYKRLKDVVNENDTFKQMINSKNEEDN